MPETVRAKMKCTEKHRNEYAQSVVLKPVVGQSDENKSFYKATPGGEVKLDVMNDAAADAFVVGKEYYVDFTPA